MKTPPHVKIISNLFINIPTNINFCSCLGKPSIKKRWKLGFCPNLSDLPPSLAYLGILNCYFFIAYLGSIDHEMDFEINLFFPLTKVSWHLENFCILQYTFFINQIENWQIFLSIRPTHPKNAKMFFVFIICFRAF